MSILFIIITFRKWLNDNEKGRGNHLTVSLSCLNLSLINDPLERNIDECLMDNTYKKDEDSNSREPISDA